MATHSSVLPWRIPGTGEPGGLPSMGSNRVRHDWSDLAAAKCSWQHGQRSPEASFGLLGLRQRHYFADKGPSSQSYGFSSGHVWMWELDYKESWAPKNWCFWNVVLEKTLESLLDCKETKPVHPEGNQSWIFIGSTDTEAEARSNTLATWCEELTHLKRSWWWERLRAGASASASVLPMNIQDWFPLGWTGLVSLQSKGLSRVFSNITVQKHQFLYFSYKSYCIYFWLHSYHNFPACQLKYLSIYSVQAFLFSQVVIRSA